MAKRGRFEAAKPAGGGWKKALIVILCIVLVFAILIAAGLHFLKSKLNRITQAEFVDKGTTAELDIMAGGAPPATEPVVETTEAPTEPETTAAPTEPDYGQTGKIVNIMLVGSDSREFEEHKLADTMLLFTLNKETKKLTMTSFLRDSYVDLPDEYRGHTCGWNRINTAYALGYGWFGDAGAMDMLNTTIKGNYGVDIDGNVEVTFYTFEVLLNMLGGVNIVLDEDEARTMNEYVDNYRAWDVEELWGWELHYFDVGLNYLNGREALWFARMRHANNADSDIKRAGRQRMIVSEVLNKLRQKNLLELNALVDEILPEIVTNISPEDMMVYIRELLPYIFEVELVSNQCPAEGTYWGEMVDLPDGPGGVLQIDFDANRRLLAEICAK